MHDLSVELPQRCPRLSKLGIAILAVLVPKIMGQGTMDDAWKIAGALGDARHRSQCPRPLLQSSYA